MSKRRQPGEKVKRMPGSGFLGSAEPMFLRIPTGAKYDEYTLKNREGERLPCLVCDDPECREWANLEIADGPFKGQHMFHISECQMEDCVPEPPPFIKKLLESGQGWTLANESEDA